MPLIIDDATVLVQFRGTRTPIELRAPDGRLLGHFVPAFTGPLDPALLPQISEEELQRRERAGGGRPLQDLLADLEKQA